MHYPAFVDNITFYRLDQSKSQLDQFVGMTENLKRVHQLSAQSYGSFEDMIKQYLQAGIEIFQMETGIVSQITADKQYIVKDVISPLSVLEAGAVYELQDTYCREVYKTHRVIGLPQIGNIAEMHGHPVYQNLKLEAYLSAPIDVNGKLFGTFNFTSTTPRSQGFSQLEFELISLMAQSIGSFILLQEKENSLLALNERLKTLVGHVSHDLRTPLGVISNLAKIINETSLDDDQRTQLISRIDANAQRSLELVNTILDIAALGSGKITLQKNPINLVDIINDCLQNYQMLAAERHVQIVNSLPSNLTLMGDEARLSQAFNNLIGNAAKYAAEDSNIVLSHDQNANQMSICIHNNTAADYQNVVAHHATKSIGFGLEITLEVLALHGGELLIEQTPDSYIATVKMPQAGSQP